MKAETFTVLRIEGEVDREFGDPQEAASYLRYRDAVDHLVSQFKNKWPERTGETFENIAYYLMLNNAVQEFSLLEPKDEQEEFGYEVVGEEREG